jgi:hypothetical protein
MAASTFSTAFPDPVSPIPAGRRKREMRLQTRAFGFAGGLLAAGGVFLWTVLLLAAGGAGSAPLLLRSFLFGWDISAAGAFVGAMWAFAWGFLLGAGFAFVYNLVVVPPAPPPFDWDAEPGGEG